MTADLYRVLASTRTDDELLVLDVTDATPVYVTTAGYTGELRRTIDSIEPGNLLEASFDWSGERPRFETVSVRTRTTFSFVPGATNVFEAAVTCWERTRAAGEPMDSTLTYDTDGNPNGVVYVFAEQSGERSLFEEFRDGVTPLDPLFEPIEHADPPYALFCLAPERYSCVVVTIAFDREGLFANTMRETYTE